MKTEFHAYSDRGKEITKFYFKNDQHIEELELPWSYLGESRQDAHNRIMNDLFGLCFKWKNLTGEDYSPIPSGTAFHEYDLVQNQGPSTKRTIWVFDR